MTGPACAPAVLSYRAVRLRHCRSALKDFLRRWGAYLLVGAAVGGIGTPAVAAGAVLPLLHSVASPGWAAPTLLLYVLAGASLLWAARSLLWPQAWAECERALPIPRRERYLSDLQVVALALLPLALVYSLGAWVVVRQDPAWLRPHQGLALMALSGSWIGAGALGWAGLQVLRQLGARGSGRVRAPGAVAATRAGAAWSRHWFWAILVLPLWRGPAQPTGLALLLGTLMLLLPGLTLHLRSAWADWCLAASAALALVVVARLRTLAESAFGPLLVACTVLPIAPQRLRLARAGLVLLPGLLGLVVLLVGLLAGPVPIPVRPWVCVAYVGVSLAAWSAEAMFTPRDPAHHAARWLLSLALTLALASEVVA